MQIDNLSTWPTGVLEYLQQDMIIHLFLNATYMDQIPLAHNFSEVADQLVQHVYAGGLVGFHCSKEPRPGYFRESGLRLMNPEQSITDFLTLYKDKFPPAAYLRLEIGLKEWLQHEQMKHRSEMVWFCLTRNIVSDNGTDSFFRYFGGEIIYWPFKRRDEEVSNILEQIGRPVVVEAILSMESLQCFGDDNFVKSCLSFYGKTVNPISMHMISKGIQEPQ